MRSYLVGGLSVLVLLAAGMSLSVACSEPEGTSYGNPSALDRKDLPGEGGVAPLSCGGGEGGAGTKFDGGCPSFATDIYPYFSATGKWQCASAACHGGTTKPDIVGANPAAVLASLHAVTLLGKPYIPGSDAGTAGDLTTTTELLCNLQGACGSKMPKPPGTDPTADELCMTSAWIACGAPP